MTKGRKKHRSGTVADPLAKPLPTLSQVLGVHQRVLMWMESYMGWDFVRGQFRGENFFFQFGVEIFPTKYFCAIQGTFCSLCILSGAEVSHV